MICFILISVVPISNATNQDNNYKIISNNEIEYTKEYNLVKLGWIYEGISWYSADSKQQAIYRLYNPNAQTGTHHFTAKLSEKNQLVSAGWIYEGIAWYANK